MMITPLSVSGFPFPPVEKQTPDAGSSQAQKLVLETKTALNESRLRLLKEIPVPGKLSPYSRPAASTVASQGGRVYAQRLPDNTLILRDQEYHGKRFFIELKPDNTLGRVLLDGKEIQDPKLKTHPKTLQEVKKIADLYFEKTAGFRVESKILDSTNFLAGSTEKAIKELEENPIIDRKTINLKTDDATLEAVQAEICAIGFVAERGLALNNIISDRLAVNNPSKAITATTFKKLRNQSVDYAIISAASKSPLFPCEARLSPTEMVSLHKAPFSGLVAQQQALAQQLLSLSQSLSQKVESQGLRGKDSSLDSLLEGLIDVTKSLSFDVVQSAQQEGLKIPK